jgi:hypothetical protein
MLEDALAAIEALTVPAGDVARTLTVYAPDLPPDAVRAVPPTVDAVRAHIRALAADLGLQPRYRSRRQAVRALVVSEIVRLEDSTADRLGGYGAVHPDAAVHLDPVLHAMRAELAALLRLVNHEDAPAV